MLFLSKKKKNKANDRRDRLLFCSDGRADRQTDRQIEYPYVCTQVFVPIVYVGFVFFVFHPRGAPSVSRSVSQGGRERKSSESDSLVLVPGNNNIRTSSLHDGISLLCNSSFSPHVRAV